MTLGTAANSTAAHTVAVSFADKLHQIRAHVEAFARMPHRKNATVANEFLMMHRADPQVWKTQTTYAHWRMLALLPDTSVELIQADAQEHSPALLTYENVYADAATSNKFCHMEKGKTRVYDGEKWVIRMYDLCRLDRTIL